MSGNDVVVVGAGISGLSFAHYAAAAGRQVTVLEASDRPGGCIRSERLDTGYWFEMGAHTCYNSYGLFIELIEACGLMERLLPRAKVSFRMLRDGELQSVMAQVGLTEAASHAWRMPFLSKQDRTVEQYFSALVGKRNYARFLGQFLAAVPCQRADAFPADMLFKKRPRRTDVLRSFTLDGGLQTLCDALAARDEIDVRTGTSVEAVEALGDHYSLRTSDGAALTAQVVAIATPAGVAATLLAGIAPAAGDALAGVGTAEVESTGVVVRADAVSLPALAGIVPAQDIFRSAVSRDVVADPNWRAFTFHFPAGVARADRLERIAGVIGVPQSAFEAVADGRASLPSPVLGHAATVAAVDDALAGGRVALTGNYFAGLALEDCISRSHAEAQRTLAV